MDFSSGELDAVDLPLLHALELWLQWEVGVRGDQGGLLQGPPPLNPCYLVDDPCVWDKAEATALLGALSLLGYTL